MILFRFLHEMECYAQWLTDDQRRELVRIAGAMVDTSGGLPWDDTDVERLERGRQEREREIRAAAG